MEIHRVIGPLLALTLRRDEDVSAARQQARELAGLLGFDRQDQTRIAAAVSEVARNAVVHAGGGRIAFTLAGADDDRHFGIEVRDDGPGISDIGRVLDGTSGSPRPGMGLIAARRLVDGFEASSAPGRGTTIRMSKRLPAGAARDPVRFVAHSGGPGRPDPVAEMDMQQRELLASLTELSHRQEELGRVNAELEDTNRGVVALYAELDERAEQLRQASELKSRFLSNMSHEFRTPLNSILAISRLLLEQADGPLGAEQQRQVTYIRQSAETLTSMVNDLLDLAKVEAGKLDVTPNRLTVTGLFGALRGLMRPLRTEGVELVFEDASRCPPLYADEAKVAQVLRNLISNALKFTEQGEIRVAVSYDPGARCAAFTVRDTGIGIAAEDQERIFQEFTQVRSALQERVRGTGLGLPLARRLAELLGGTLTVQSRPGEGSMFRFVIPAHADGLDPLASPAHGAGAPPRRRVLVADDEESFRYLLRRLIGNQADLEVIEAADGAEALRLAREQRPDVLFLDLRMPKLDGYEVLAALRADQVLRDITVIVCTSSVLDSSDYKRLAGSAILSKSSLDRGTISASLRAALASKERE